MKRKDPVEEFLALSDADKEAVWRQYDRPFVADDARPLSPAQRRQWNRIRRKRGRPRVGKGAERVSVTIERSLLKMADREAKKRGLSRAKLIALGLRTIVPPPTRRAA